jgi:hypothetical protein
MDYITGLKPTKVDSIEHKGYIVELHHNPILKFKPYLIRVYSYNNDPYEIRVNKIQLDQFNKMMGNFGGNELKGLADFINNYLENN